MKSKKAFTLIELLVVIAIIALLMSIILPSMRRVKQQATGTVCLSNIRQLGVAWQTYSSDNDSEIPHGHVPRDTTYVTDNPTHRFWVHYPQTETGVCKGEPADVRLEYELNGIKAGALFSYLDTTDVYHCPGDKSKQVFEKTDYWETKPWWNSYSVSGMMNGEELYRSTTVEKVVKKSSEIKNAASKVVFLENADERGWLMGSWLMNYGGTPSWIDPIAVWHYERSTLGFADGHVEMQKWEDESTLENAKAGKVVFAVPKAGESGNDIQYAKRTYVPR